MGFLSDLIGKAKSWLGDKPVGPTETEAVFGDRFDREVFRETTEAAPALRNMAYDQLGHYDYSETLVEDAFRLFWQADPTVTDASRMKPEFLANHAAIDHLQNDPTTTSARQYTKHDQYGAAMATISVAEKVKKHLDEANKEAEEKAKEAERKREEAEAAREAAEQAQEQLEEALGDQDPDAEGPLTEDQNACMEGLTTALQAAQQAEVDAQEANQQAQQAAAAVRTSLRKPVHEGVQEAEEKLAEEQQLMAAWGVDPGELKQMDFQTRANLARALRNNRLSKFRQLIGRFRQMAAAQRAKKVEYGRDEVVGVELSDDIPRVLGSEFAKAKAHHALKLDFLVRLGEAGLMSRKYAGVEKVGDGAIIAMVDCSASMTDEDKDGISREAWAKAMALSLLDQARAGKRDFVGINFASHGQVKVWRFPKGEAPIGDVLAFTEHFFNGGTDFESPINEGMKILEEEFNEAGKQRGDLVLITDGECGVRPDWMRKYQARKAQLDFRTFGIQVGDDVPLFSQMEDGSSTLEALSDNTRMITEFADPSSVADIMRVI